MPLRSATRDGLISRKSCSSWRSLNGMLVLLQPLLEARDGQGNGLTSCVEAHGLVAAVAAGELVGLGVELLGAASVVEAPPRWQGLLVQPTLDLFEAAQFGQRQ